MAEARAKEAAKEAQEAASIAQSAGSSASTALEDAKADAAAAAAKVICMDIVVVYPCVAVAAHAGTGFITDCGVHLICILCNLYLCFCGNLGRRD